MVLRNAGKPLQGSIFTFLSDLFARHGVTGVLVGGYALIANKVQRMTFDIDFITTAEDCEKIEPDLLLAGYSVRNRMDAFVQYKSETAGLRDLDILICDRKTLEALVAQGRQVIIAGKLFVVPSPAHQIAMKLHAIFSNKEREPKDFPDIVKLISANSLDPRSDAIKELFVRYKAMDLYDKVLKATGAGHGTGS